MCNRYSEERWRGGRSIRRPWPWLALLLLWAGRAQGWELEGGVGAGYDSNPGRTPDGDGYALARLRASAQESWPDLPFDGELALDAKAVLDGFEGGEGRERWRVEGRLQRALMGGRLRSVIVLDGVRYRDDFAPEDERDEAGAALELLAVLSASHELTLTGAFEGLDYLRCVATGGGHPMGHSHGNPGQGPIDNGPCADGERVDRLSTLGLAWTTFPAPGITGTLRAWQARNRSDLETESYRQSGAGGALEYGADSGWGAAAGLLWYTSRYDDDPQGRREERVDHTATLTLALSRRVAPFEFVAELRLVDNDSSVATEAFREEVLWLGVSRSF